MIHTKGLHGLNTRPDFFLLMVLLFWEAMGIPRRWRSHLLFVAEVKHNLLYQYNQVAHIYRTHLIAAQVDSSVRSAYFHTSCHVVEHRQEPLEQKI
jgi:hypothetical protein